MSAIAELYFSNTKNRLKKGELDSLNPVYLVAGYHLPILWLALFETQDELVSEKGVDSEWHYYAKPILAALALLAKRRDFIIQAFPDLNTEWIGQFEEVIRNSEFPYVHIETSAVGSVVCTPDEWNTEMRTILTLFSEQYVNFSSQPKRGGLMRMLFGTVKRTGSVAYQERFGSQYLDSDKQQAWVYCGASGDNRTYPWEV